MNDDDLTALIARKRAGPPTAADRKSAELLRRQVEGFADGSYAGDVAGPPAPPPAGRPEARLREYLAAWKTPGRTNPRRKD